MVPDKVQMKLRSPGYLRPAQTEALTPTEDRQIASICPGLGQSVEAEGRVDDVLWGPYVSMHTGYATQTSLRHTASSGGGLSAVLVHLLESGQVPLALGYAAISVFGGLLATWAGLSLTKL